MDLRKFLNKKHVLDISKSEVVKNFLIYSFGAVLLKGISFFLLPIYTRVLTTAEYGQLDIIDTFIAILSTIFGLGLNQVIFINYYHLNKSKRLRFITNILITYVLLVTPVMLILSLRTDMLNLYLFKSELTKNIVLISLLSVYTSFFVSAFFSALRISRRAKFLTIVQVGTALFAAAMNIYLVWYLKKGVIAIILTNLVVQIITMLIAAIAYLNKTRDIDLSLHRSEVKEYVTLGLPFVPGALAAWALAGVSRWLLLEYTTLAQVGIYGLAFKFGMLVRTTFLMSFSSSYQPKLFSRYKEDIKKAEKYNNRILRYYLLFGFVGILLIFPIFKPIFNIFIGKDFQESYQYLFVILLAFFFYGASEIACNRLLYTKKVIILTSIAVLSALVNIALNVIFIPKFKIWAASISLLLSYLFLFLITYALKEYYAKLDNLHEKSVDKRG